jgi:hypothetical protein
MVAAPSSATVIASAEISVDYSIVAPLVIVILPDTDMNAPHGASAGSLAFSDASATFNSGLRVGSASAEADIMAAGGFAAGSGVTGTEFLINNPTASPLTVTVHFFSASASASATADLGDTVQHNMCSWWLSPAMLTSCQRASLLFRVFPSLSSYP